MQVLHNLADLHPDGVTAILLQVFEVPAGVEGHEVQRFRPEADKALEAVTISEQLRGQGFLKRNSDFFFQISRALQEKLLLPAEEPLAVAALASPFGHLAQAGEELLAGQDRHGSQD